MPIGKDATFMDNVFLEALPQRVGKLEEAVQGLHKDQAILGNNVASMESSMKSLAATVITIDQKLDAARTRRPDLGALASWGLVLLTIMGMTFAGLSWRMTGHEQRLETYGVTHSTVDETNRLEDRFEALEERFYEHMIHEHNEAR